MTAHAIQRRIMAKLIAAIHGIVDALMPVIDNIAGQPTRPWQQRARYADRFNAIIQELLALTTRIRPATLSTTPSFPSAPPRPAPQTQPAPKAQPEARPRRTRRPAAAPRRLSARQLAQRLANLLRQLQRLAIEAGAAIPDTIRHHITQARTLAGCNALPTPTIAWKRPSWEHSG